MSLAELLYTMLLHQVECENKEDKAPLRHRNGAVPPALQQVCDNLGRLACDKLVDEYHAAAPGCFRVTKVNQGHSIAAMPFTGEYDVENATGKGFVCLFSIAVWKRD